MRRRNKYILNGALVAGGTTALLDILLQWLEHKQNGIEFTWKRYDGMRTVKRSLVGGTIGGALGYSYYCFKIKEEANLPFNPDHYLKKTLTEEHLKTDAGVFNNVIAQREKVKEWLINEFGNRLVAMPEDTGSFYKRTAIASNYDLDIILPFGRYSYSSLQEMYYDVYERIGKKFQGYALVTRQTKAIGLTFMTAGNEIHFDIVPGREINNYLCEKTLILYVNPTTFWQKGGSFKTNVNFQKKITVNNPDARTTIKLLKLYRDRNSLPLPTLVIEQCVVNALSENKFGVSSSTTENLLNYMEYISEKIQQKRLLDIANSNNNLNAKIDELQKNRISNQLINDVMSVEENPRYIKEIFYF